MFLSLSLSFFFFARSAPILLFIQCDAFSHAWSVSSVYLTRSVLTPKRPGVGEGLQLPLGDPLPPRACAAQFCASQRSSVRRNERCRPRLWRPVLWPLW